MMSGQSGAHSTRPWFEWVADLVIATALILLFLPLLTAAAIAIKCDSRGRILIGEPRIGPSGQQFWALKFRCTAAGSGDRRYSEREVTRVGSIIQYLRIDTLPQLVNVLRGEMTCFPADRDYLFFLE